MKTAILAIVSGFLLLVGTHAQTLIGGWDFQTTATGGTALNPTGLAQPTVFNANFGSGTLFLDGTQGSSSWISSDTTDRQLNAFDGTLTNAGPGFSTATNAPAALAFVNQTANGNFAVFKFDLSSVVDPIRISLAAVRSLAGFTSQTWEWSTNGTDYSLISTLTAGVTGTIKQSFADTGVVSLPEFSDLSGAPEAYVRITFAGATAAGGNHRVDNIQFNAVPEPSTYALLSLGALALGGYAVRRRARK
jgi:hypothetical protein